MSNTKDYNVGTSNYTDFETQPWDIWERLASDIPLKASIIKRWLRIKPGEQDLDIEKIEHELERLADLQNETTELLVLALRERGLTMDRNIIERLI